MPVIWQTGSYCATNFNYWPYFTTTDDEYDNKWKKAFETQYLNLELNSDNVIHYQYLQLILTIFLILLENTKYSLYKF